jgi:16S rRNA (uracil1498-N3)-methyltransferase
MRINRFFTPQALGPGIDVELEEKTAHYMSRVLRVRPGQAVVLFNGDGFDYAAEISAMNKKQLTASVSARLPGASESPVSITMVQAISRGERMDQSLQKCTELGAAAFQPLVTERVEVRLNPDRLAGRMAHWRRVVISACEQSGRAIIPEVYAPTTLTDWLDSPSGNDRICLALDPGGDEFLIQPNPGQNVEIVIGPEGGFTSAETRMMSHRGVTLLRLGSRVLRTETAGPAALAVLQAVAGDFVPGSAFRQTGRISKN